MSFEKFEASFKLENKWLKISLITVTVLLGIITSLIYSSKKYFVYQGKEIFEERLLNVEVCHQGFKSLASSNPNPHLVHEGIIEIVEKDSFNIQVDKFLMVKSTLEGECKIVIKSEGKLLAYNAKLEESLKNPFYYRIIQLDEVVAMEGEQ
jgi:hypothetical protein